MSLRATTAVPVPRSVDTVADLEAIDTSFLVDGDEAFTSATSQLWLLIATSSAVVSPTVRIAAGGGRWFLVQTFPVGAPEPLVVANVAALAGLSATLPDETVAWIESFRTYLRLERSNVQTPDGVIIMAAVGGGNWIRDLSYRDEAWGLQATWAVNPATGDDENVGSLASPLETWAEFTRRVQKVAVSMTVNFVGDQLEEIVGEFTSSSGAFTLTLLGVPEELTASTVATYTAANFALNTPPEMTCGDIPDFTPYIEQIIEFTDGDADGMVASVFGDDAGAAQLSAITDLVLLDLAAVAPSPGDAFRILDLPEVASLNVRAFGALSLVVKFLNVVATVVATNQISSDAALLSPRFEACRMTKMTGSKNLFIYGCTTDGFPRGIGGGGCQLLYVGGLLYGGVINTTGCIVTADGLTMMDGGFVVPSGEVYINNNLGMFGTSSNYVDRGGYMEFAGDCWGEVTSDPPLAVRNGGVVGISTGNQTVVPGNTDDFLLDGVVSNLNPINTGDAGASLPAAQNCSTWAQWAAAGFSGYVVNYTTLSKIITLAN